MPVIGGLSLVPRNTPDAVRGICFFFFFFFFSLNFWISAVSIPDVGLHCM